MIPFLRDNSVVFLGLLSWFIAQLIKFIIEVSTHRKINWRRFFESGGMPSSHSAFVCSIAMGIGFREGFASTFFALAFMIAMVVILRRHGRAPKLRETRRPSMVRGKISEDQVEEDPFPEWGKPLREALGHKPTEVISGAILGIAVSFLAF